MLACSITGRVAGGSELETTFIYDSNHPFEVKLQSVTGDVMFARDLMAESFAQIDRAGVGHVRLTASSTMFFLAINTGPHNAGWFKVAYPREPVELFLTESYNVVPFGSEKMDFDALLEAFNEDKI